MDLSRITEENIDDFSAIIDEDVAENIGRKYYRGLALTDNDDPVGSIVWEYRNAQEFDMESELNWFYLKEGKYGAPLFEAYKKEIIEKNVIRSFFEMPKPEDFVYDVFSEQSFDMSSQESRDIVVRLSDLADNKIAQKKAPSYVMGLNDISVREFRMGIIACLFNGRRGLYEDLSNLPIGWYDQNISCAVQTDNEITGFFLIHRTASDMLVPVLLYASGPNSRQDLLGMIRFTIRSALMEYQPDTKVLIRRHSTEVKTLTDNLFPGIKGKEIVSGERDE